MPTALEWIDPATGEAHAGLSFSGAVPGVPGPVKAVELWNDRDQTLSADTARQIRIIPEARPLGSDDPYQEAGHAILDRLGLQIRIAGSGLGGASMSPTSWQAIGAGAWLDIPAPLLAGQGAPLEVRDALPPGISTPAMQVRFRVDSRRALPLARGIWESVGSGVLHGLGNVTQSAVLQVSGEVTTNGDDTVTVPDVSYVLRGVPYARLGTVETLPATDTNGDPLAAGEGYLAALVLTSSDLDVVRGAKALLGAMERPALPEDSLLWAWVTRDSDGVIEAPDLEEVAPLGAYGLRSISGRTLRLGAGQALAGGWHTRSDVEANYDAPASATSTVWLLPDGSILPAIELPESQALALYEVDTDAASITATRDVRRWLGGRQFAANLTILDPQVGGVTVWANPTGRPLDILPDSMAIELHEDAAGLGGSGEWRFEVEQRAPGGAWVSLFTSSATDDRRPAIQADGTVSEIYPEVLTIEPGAVVRLRVLSVAASASGVSLRLPLWGGR